MAETTSTKLRNELIYQVFPRNYSEAGTFKGVEKDLDRIKALGTTIVYLLPVHPIGKIAKKGTLGCPYSIQDYRIVNPDLGTIDDFKSLIAAVHAKKMKLMIDVVYNHTSRDSRLLSEHPEWFYRKPDGSPANRVGDWSDVTDIDYSKDGVQEELISTLVYWASLGVDGFRCDVASLVPHDFWMKARSAVNRLNPDFIWLAESVDLSFIKYLRDLGYETMSDSQTFDAFDICYDYDIFSHYENYLLGKESLETYITAMAEQEMIYPDNYIKLRCLENHDRLRIAGQVSTDEQVIMYTGFQFMLKGCPMIYNGQEALEKHRQSLFDKENVNWSRLNERIWNNKTMSDLIYRLSNLRKDKVFADGVFEIKTGEVNDTVIISYKDRKRTGSDDFNYVIYGIFNLGMRQCYMKLDNYVKDGEYENLIMPEDDKIIVENNKVKLGSRPLIFKIK